MSRRQLSISDILAAYSGVDDDLLDRDAALDEARCSACGAEVVETENELFKCCASCGREIEAGE